MGLSDHPVGMERDCSSLLAKEWESVCELRRRAHGLRLAAWPGPGVSWQWGNRRSESWMPCPYKEDKL